MAPGRQLGLIWGAVAAILVALSPWAPALATGLPGCPLVILTGIPCPSCGTTRAALALARFDPLAALALNPLAAAGWIALVAGGLVAGAAALAGRGVEEPSGRLRLGWRLAMVLAALANWAWVIRVQS